MLLFHLLLRQKFEKDQGCCEIGECEELAKMFRIPVDDVKKVLKYLHHTLGTILYYEDIESLKDIVFCNPNLLLNQITQLITMCFTRDSSSETFGRNSKGALESLSLTCWIMFCDASEKDSIISRKQVIDFLEYHKLVMEIGDGKDRKGKEELFMPCLMLPNPDIADISKQDFDNL